MRKSRPYSMRKYSNQQTQVIINHDRPMFEEAPVESKVSDAERLRKKILTMRRRNAEDKLLRQEE